MQRPSIQQHNQYAPIYFVGIRISILYEFSNFEVMIK